MSLSNEARRGDEARKILDNAVYKEAWSAYQDVLVRLLASADTPKDKADELRALLIGSHKARAHMERIMREGAYAAAQIEQENTKKMSLAARMFRAA